MPEEPQVRVEQMLTVVERPPLVRPPLVRLKMVRAKSRFRGLPMFRTGYLNGESFQQDGIISYNGYQYTAFWNTNRQVVMARRKLPSGAWSKFDFTDTRTRKRTPTIRFRWGSQLETELCTCRSITTRPRFITGCRSRT